MPRWSGCSIPGVRSVDEGTAYVLVKTAQILAQPDRAGERDPRARRRSDGGAARSPQRIERETGYKSVAWQEAHEDLLSAFVIRNIIMYTVVGAILLVASFGTYNIISTITHEKTRDIAILKSLGLREATVRRIFVIEAHGDRHDRRAGRLAAGLRPDPRARHRSRSRSAAFTDMTRLPLAYSFAALRASPPGWRSPPRWWPATSRRARPPLLIRSTSSAGRHERSPDGKRRPGAADGQALIDARRVTRILPGVVPTTLVHDIDLAIGEQRVRGDHRARRAPASRRCSTCSACSTCRPRARCGSAGAPRPQMDEAERAAGPARHARLRVPVPLPAAGVLGARQRRCCRCGRSGGCRAAAMRERARALLASLGLADHMR